MTCQPARTTKGAERDSDGSQRPPFPVGPFDFLRSQSKLAHLLVRPASSPHLLLLLLLLLHRWEIHSPGECRRGGRGERREEEQPVN